MKESSFLPKSPPKSEEIRGCFSFCKRKPQQIFYVIGVKERDSPPIGSQEPIAAVHAHPAQQLFDHLGTTPTLSLWPVRLRALCSIHLRCKVPPAPPPPAKKTTKNKQTPRVPSASRTVRAPDAALTDLFGNDVAEFAAGLDDALRPLGQVLVDLGLEQHHGGEPVEHDDAHPARELVPERPPVVDVENDHGQRRTQRQQNDRRAEV